MFCGFVRSILKYLRKIREFSEERSETYSDLLIDLYRRQCGLRKVKWLENKIHSEKQLQRTVWITENMLIWFWQPIIYVILLILRLFTSNSVRNELLMKSRNFSTTSEVKIIRPKYEFPKRLRKKKLRTIELRNGHRDTVEYANIKRSSHTRLPSSKPGPIPIPDKIAENYNPNEQKKNRLNLF